MLQNVCGANRETPNALPPLISVQYAQILHNASQLHAAAVTRLGAPDSILIVRSAVHKQTKKTAYLSSNCK